MDRAIENYSQAKRALLGWLTVEMRPYAHHWPQGTCKVPFLSLGGQSHLQMSLRLFCGCMCVEGDSLQNPWPQETHLLVEFYVNP